MDIFNSEQKCQIHPENKVEFIQIKDVNDQKDCRLFYCGQCIDLDKCFKPMDYVFIDNVINHGTNSIILKWPPVNDQQIIEQLSKSAAKFSSGQPIEQQISNYFTQLKEEILKKIDICQKKMINRAQELPFSNYQIVAKYQEISKILELRQLLNDQQEPVNTKEDNYKKFIQQMLSQKERNTQQLQNLLNQQLISQELVNFEQPKQMKESLLQFVDQINFFNEELITVNSTNKKDVKKQKSNDEQNASEKLMKLISNKSNFCSNQFLTQLQQLLQKVNPILESISFDNLHENNKHPINFNAIDEVELEMINSHVTHLGKIKSDQTYQNEVKKSAEIKQMSRILNNKFNSINNKFKEQFEKFMISTYPYLRHVNFKDMITNMNQLACFEDLDEDVFSDMFEFAHKFKDRKQMNCTNPQLVNEIKPIINRHFHFLKQSDIDTLLIKYPIFDLIQQPKLLDVLPIIEMNKENSYLLINRSIYNNQIEIQSNRKREFYYDFDFDDINFSAKSNISLVKNKKYIFRFQLQQTNNSPSQCSIGLVPFQEEQMENKSQFTFQYNLNQNTLTYRGGVICKKIKGNDYLNLQYGTLLELRVSINEQILEIHDYPNYNYQYCIYDDYKQSLINSNELKLYIEILDPCKLILTNAFVVESFEQ